MKNSIASKIENMVGTLRIQHQLRVPINAKLLLRKLGVKRITPKNSVSFVEVLPDSKFILCVGAGKPSTQYAIAHLLGHLLLHLNPKIPGKFQDDIRYRFGYSEEEHQANFFSQALMLPEKEFREACLKYEKNGKLNLLTLSRHFHVPVCAIYERGAWLRIFDYDN